MTAGAKGHKLDWVEVGRGLAALAVVCSHMPPISRFAWNESYGLGAMGVEFFFLLSGFIMLQAHWRDVGQPGSIRLFAWRRAGRIFPAYWIAVVLLLIVDQLLVSAAHRATIDPWFLFRQAALLPGAPLFVGPAWTLRHEVFFYLVFTVLILNQRAGLMAFAIWMAAVLVALPLFGPGMRPTHSLSEVVLHHYNLDFALGMALAISLRGAMAGRALIVTFGGAAIAIAVWAYDGFRSGGWFQVIAYKAIFCVMLAAAVQMSRSRFNAPRALLLLGAAS